jgi:hypothetical protein
MQRKAQIGLRLSEELRQKVEAEQAVIQDEHPGMRISLSDTVRILVVEALMQRQRNREDGHTSAEEK